MRPYIQKTINNIQEQLDVVCNDKRVSREEYREFLEEVQTGIGASLDALKDDDRRDAALAREK